jgi:hypothetical protein
VVEKQDTKSKTEKINNLGGIKIVCDLVKRVSWKGAGHIHASRLVTVTQFFSALHPCAAKNTSISHTRKTL